MSDADDKRLAKAIEAYRVGLSAPDPEMVLSMLMDAARRKTPGDPFNASIDQLVEHLFKSQDVLGSPNPADYAKRYLRIVSEQVKTMVAEKLEKPSLADGKMLTIAIDDDWQINASVEQRAPYSIRVSTNLFLFCARVSELLVSGVQLNVVDDRTARQHTALQLSSPRQVAGDVKKILDSFSADQMIARTDVRLKAAHTMFHQTVFHAIMALIVCHEFGHVVINETRRAGQPVPFADRARGELDRNFDDLIVSGRHDSADRAGLRKLPAIALQGVRASWENEITADLLGISLAREYVERHGPWKTSPDVVPTSYIGFHLCFVAQHYLHAYLQKRRPGAVLMSKTHPPVDFRLHCLLGWMYGRPARDGRPAVPYGEHQSYKAVTWYCDKILNEIFA